VSGLCTLWATALESLRRGLKELLATWGSSPSWAVPFTRPFSTSRYRTGIGVLALLDPQRTSTVYCSVVDPGCSFWIPDPNFSIPDPGSRVKSLIPDPNPHQTQKPKNCFQALGNMVRDVHPGSRIRGLVF
jgi:hypothetical protein